MVKSFWRTHLHINDESLRKCKEDWEKKQNDWTNRTEAIKTVDTTGFTETSGRHTDKSTENCRYTKYIPCYIIG